MKKMNKILAAILALVMLLSLPSTGFTYYTGTAGEGAAYAEKYIMALNTLYGLGVLPDNTPRDYEAGITREEFAKAAGALLGGREILNIPEPTNQNITLGEAAQMLVDGTENGIRAEKYGYMALAGAMGITHGLVRMQSYDNLTYGAAVQMLYNSMRITPGDAATFTQNDVEYVFNENRTVLSEYLELDYKQGFVTADGFWSLSPTGELDENKIVINGKTLTLKYAGLDDYVGFYVNYYYDAQEDIVLAVEKAAAAKRVILDSDDVTSYSSNMYTCFTDGRKTTYKVEAGAYIISNYIPNMSTSVDMYPANSDIVLIDADGDNTYETVFIKTYTEIKVGMINVEGDIISGKGGIAYNLNEDVPARVYLNGKKVDYTSVSSNLHASLVVEPTRTGVKSYVREIYLSDKSVSGAITAITSDEEKMRITVGEDEYQVALSAADKRKIELGTTGTFSLNFKGEIAYMEKTSTTGGPGYVMKLGWGKGINKPLQMQLMASDGTYPIYNVAKKCKLNGSTPVNETEGIFDAFTDAMDAVVQQLILYETNSKGEISEITLPLADASTLKYGDYKLHLVAESPDENGDAIKYSTHSKSFSEKSLYNDDTIIFNVPSTNSDNLRDYEVAKDPISTTYKVYHYEINDPYADVVVSVRQTTAISGGVCGGPGPEIDKNRPGTYSIVISHKKAYVEEYGDYFDQIEFVGGTSGTVQTKILADNALYVAFSGSEADQCEILSYDTGHGDFDLNPGDIFTYSLNTKDELGTIHKVYDASDASLVIGDSMSKDAQSRRIDYTVDNFASSFAAAYVRAIHGYAVDATENYLTIARTAPGTLAEVDRSNLSFYNYHKDMYAYEVTLDGNNTEVKKITLGQITPAQNVNEHLILTTVSGGYLRLVAVYKTAD